MATTSSTDTVIMSASEILEQLTLEEKVSLLSGKTIWRTGAIPRLGIKAIKTSDGPNGCRGEAIHASTKSSCFPCGACMGATFNTDLLQEIGAAIGIEAQLKNVGVILGPTINIHRHPYGGRNFESYSEDPVLSGELSAAYVNGLQSQQVAATPKHYVCNECEGHRHNSNSIVDEKTLRELYLLPFQICLRKSTPWALMTSYNKVNGTWASENSYLIDHILRKEWGFEGCTMSDFGGVYTEVAPVTAGLNLEMPGPSVYRGQKLMKHVQSGTVLESDVDKNALRVIQLALRVGMVDEDAPEVAQSNKEISATIRQAANEGIVLLKNKENLLPITPSTEQKIAIFGAPASNPVIHGGGSPSLASHYIITPVDALKAIYPTATYSYGVPIFRKVPSAPIDCMMTAAGEAGVDCHWYNGWNFGENEILHERLDTTRTLVIDPRIKGLEQKHCTAMQCTLTPKTSGSHCFGVTSCGETHIYIDGVEVVFHPGFDDTKVEHIMQPGRFEKRASIPMEANKEYKMVVNTLSTIAPPPPPPAFQMSPQATQVGFFENLDNQDMGKLEEAARGRYLSCIHWQQ